MAKYNVGSKVRLKRNYEFGNTQIRKTTIGSIVGIKKQGFKTLYKIRWQGVNFDIDMVGDRDFDELSAGVNS